MGCKVQMSLVAQRGFATRQATRSRIFRAYRQTLNRFSLPKRRPGWNSWPRRLKSIKKESEFKGAKMPFGAVSSRT